ncbi:MAG: hypothetical protein ACFE85_18660 [Candidatus Hodarchaeota archaeon]
MNFIKTFLITILVYLALNTVFVLIGIFVFPPPLLETDDILLIITLIFAPIFVFPSEAYATGITNLLTSADLVPDLVTFFAMIVPPLVVAILAAKLGEERDTGFNAWLITSLITCVVYAILLGIGQLFSPSLSIIWFDHVTVYGDLGTIIAVFISGIINGFFYGCISLLFARKFI